MAHAFEWVKIGKCNVMAENLLGIRPMILKLGMKHLGMELYKFI